MAVQDYQLGKLNDHLSRWHLWTVIIPRRSISGKLVSGQVWRRRQGTKWTYKKFVEYADRDGGVDRRSQWKSWWSKQRSWSVLSWGRLPPFSSSVGPVWHS